MDFLDEIKTFQKPKNTKKIIFGDELENQILKAFDAGIDRSAIHRWVVGKKEIKISRSHFNQRVDELLANRVL